MHEITINTYGLQKESRRERERDRERERERRESEREKLRNKEIRMHKYLNRQKRERTGIRNCDWIAFLWHKLTLYHPIWEWKNLIPLLLPPLQSHTKI